MSQSPLNELTVGPWVHEICSDKTSDIIWVHGGVGAGKTFGYALDHINWVIENSNCEFSWFVEPTYSLVEQAAIPTFRKIFDIMGLNESRHYEILMSKPPKIRIRNGGSTHTIFFPSGDRPQYFIAVTIGRVTIDEAGELKADAKTRAIQRVRDKNANYTQKVIGGAPQGLNWFADGANFEGIDKKKNERSIRVSTFQNEANLSPGYIQAQLKEYGHNKRKVRSWIFGHFENFFEGQAYPDYDSRTDRHELPPDPSIPICLSFDFNINPVAWVVRQKRFVREDYLDSGRFIYYSQGCSSGNSRTLIDACAEFVSKFPRTIFRNTEIKVTGDASGHQGSVRAAGSCYDEIFRHLSSVYNNVSIIAPRSNPAIVVRVEKVNKGFSYGVIKIHKDDSNLDLSLVNTAWEEGTAKIEKPKGEKWTHWGDAFGYDICEEIDFNPDDYKKFSIIQS